MSERGESRRDGSKLQPNSGRGYKKGDATSFPFVIDYKEYPVGFRVTPDVWAKVCGDAFQEDGEPVIKVIMGQGNSKVRVAVIGEDMFEEMRRAWVNFYGEKIQANGLSGD
jgi:hypothetical protein